MTYRPFDEIESKELFDRVVLAAKTGLTKFGLFRIHKGSDYLTLYRDIPPTRGMRTVLSHHYESGLTTVDGSGRFEAEALDLLRREQVLDDLSSL